MRIFLFAISVLLMLGGLATIGVAKSAIHEIQAYILFLISAVTLVGAGIIEALNQNGKILKEFKKSISDRY